MVDLPAEKQHRHRIGPGFRDAGQRRIGYAASPASRADDSWLTRDARITIGGKRSRLLIANEDRADFVVPSQSIVDRRRM